MKTIAEIVKKKDDAREGGGNAQTAILEGIFDLLVAIAEKAGVPTECPRPQIPQDRFPKKK